MIMQQNETHPHFDFSIHGTNRYSIELKVKAKIQIDSNKLEYIAANPPDFRTSFSGSGLPFANEEQAYENTPNKGSVTLDKMRNCSTIRIQTPNAYYIDLGNTFVKQHIQLVYYVNCKMHLLKVKVSDGIPYRSLTYPIQRESATFYESLWQLPVRSQEAIIRESAYPVNDIHYQNFWGPRPPK
jgi:hypothetical protein